jgi:hypothetical protein
MRINSSIDFTDVNAQCVPVETLGLSAHGTKPSVAEVRSVDCGGKASDPIGSAGASLAAEAGEERPREGKQAESGGDFWSRAKVLLDGFAYPAWLLSRKGESVFSNAQVRLGVGPSLAAISELYPLISDGGNALGVKVNDPRQGLVKVSVEVRIIPLPEKTNPSFGAPVYWSPALMARNDSATINLWKFS